jgi:Rrf2 family protein
MTAEFSVGVHALVYLAHKACLVPSAELADNICTNPARVRKVMAKLQHAGLVESREGKNSGYIALPDSESITLRQVLDALEEQAVSVHWRSGDVDRSCQICSGMGRVMDGVYAELNAVCADSLSQRTVGSILTQLFGSEAEGKAGA